MTENITLAALRGAYLDYVTKIFAVRISGVRAGNKLEARKTFNDSILIVTAEYKLMLQELEASAANDKTKTDL